MAPRTPPPERIRLTISVPAEAYEVFAQMAESSGQSLGKCMGDWLADTADGARYVALKMQKAREAPMAVMRDLQEAEVQAAWRDGLGSSNARVAEVLDDMRGRRAVGAAGRAPDTGGGGGPPRPVIRGGKSLPPGPTRKSAK